MKKCPYCGHEVMSERSNFCSSCGKQLREIPVEDAEYVAPEKERQTPMEVKFVYPKTGFEQ